MAAKPSSPPDSVLLCLKATTSEFLTREEGQIRHMLSRTARDIYEQERFGRRLNITYDEHALHAEGRVLSD